MQRKLDDESFPIPMTQPEIDSSARRRGGTGRAIIRDFAAHRSAQGDLCIKGQRKLQQHG